MSVDLYRSIEVADRFADGVRALVAQGKPVAITEFGAANYHGAGDRGARGLEIVEYDEDTGAPVRLNGEYLRDEEGQARYLLELLEIFEAGGVDSTFVFTFALHGYLHRPDGDPREDLDLASYGIVKVFEDRRPGIPRHGLGAQGRVQDAGRLLLDARAAMEGGTDKVTGETSGESRNSVLPPLDQEASSRQPLESGGCIGPWHPAVTPFSSGTMSCFSGCSSVGC